MLTSTSKRPRKWFVRQIIAAMIMVTISLFGWLRLAESIRLWDILIEIGLNPSPLYLEISGGLVGIYSLVAGISLLARSKKSMIYTRLWSILLSVWLICDHVFLSHKLQTAGDWIWLFISVLVFVIIIFILTSSNKQFDSGTVKGEK